MECDRGRGLHTADLLLSSGRKLSFIATDDAHFRTGNLDAFGGWVMVKAEENTPELILDALKTGANYFNGSISRFSTRYKFNNFFNIRLISEYNSFK